MISAFSFDSMKQNLANFQPQSVQWKKEFVFLRKGVSGDFHNMISDHQWNEFMEYIEKAKYHEILVELLKIACAPIECWSRSPRNDIVTRLSRERPSLQLSVS